MALVASRNRKEAIVAKTGFPIRPIKNWIAFQLLLKSYYFAILIDSQEIAKVLQKCLLHLSFSLYHWLHLA